MAIEAPLSRYKKTNFLIYIGVCIAGAAWCGYDGYISKEFIEKHKDDLWLPINRVAPLVLLPAAALIGVYFAKVKGRKLVADENELIFSEKEKISYDAIQKIDKTHFEKKGFFVITYTGPDGKETDRKIGDRSYDNLAPILDHLVAKIT